ncbi:unnamed protein product [Citrullus colocynthis]|uniref:Uncharacterized protein n=1 Tax=Citrullus colocynthis TaxID=252529 RepID=A0ABP0Y9Z2_9ROSI
MRSIDLSKNRLHGSLPSWIGVNVSSLFLLNLGSNNFKGIIPRHWCNLPLLQVLDLSNNNLWGEVPSCLYNCTLKYVLTMDLSRNKLSGEIPNDITKLIHLFTLNLSRNDLVGTIPQNIGDMKQLEKLDLSYNHLSGRIPTSLASLNFLTHLNMSFNHFSGQIPTSNELQTLDDPSIYQGNPSLCGSPLQTKCSNDESMNRNPISTSDDDDNNNDNGSEMLGFYIGMSFGFPIGINILFFTIYTNESRRRFYIRFIDAVSLNILEKIGFLAIWLKRMRWRRSL